VTKCPDEKTSFAVPNLLAANVLLGFQAERSFDDWARLYFS